MFFPPKKESNENATAWAKNIWNSQKLECTDYVNIIGYNRLVGKHSIFKLTNKSLTHEILAANSVLKSVADDNPSDNEKIDTKLIIQSTSVLFAAIRAILFTQTDCWGDIEYAHNHIEYGSIFVCRKIVLVASNLWLIRQSGRNSKLKDATYEEFLNGRARNWIILVWRIDTRSKSKGIEVEKVFAWFAMLENMFRFSILSI